MNIASDDDEYEQHIICCLEMDEVGHQWSLEQYYDRTIFHPTNYQMDE